jgi:hypothetical protein
MATAVQAMAVKFQDKGGGVEMIRRNPGDPMKIKDSPPGSPGPTDIGRSLAAFSQTERTAPDSGAQLDIWRIRILTY